MTEQMKSGARALHLGAVLHFLQDPATHGARAFEYLPRGALLLADGRVARVGPAEALLRDVCDVPVYDHGADWLVPGFVDTHVHYPQTDIISSYGKALLDWLENYAFPAEMAFADVEHCRRMADVFLDELLRHGTTTALVFGTVHAHSADCFFAAARRRGLRMACGKVLMDQNAPAELLDTPHSAYADSRALIEKWHGQQRLTYAVTPRFAITSSAAQLAAAGRLLAEFPGVLLHTHLSENTDELQAVARLHSDAANYLDVYDRHGLVGECSVFAHGIHLQDAEWARLAEARAALSFCPTSNFMLGSGLFDAARARHEGVCVSLGSDVGGGSSFSMLRVMDEAYKCARLRGAATSPLSLWHWATLGGAQALNMDAHIGNFTEGKEGDFLALSAEELPTLARRLTQVQTVEEKLLLMAVLGDERLIKQVYVMGKEICR